MPGEITEAICPQCDGKKEVYHFETEGRKGLVGSLCPDCKGTGVVPLTSEKPFPWFYICSCGNRFSVGETEFHQQGLKRIQEHMRMDGDHHIMGGGSPPSPVPFVGGNK